jgi:hypothetical protein
MKYPITLLAVAAVMLLVGLGIHMHAEWKYTNKMYYHTVASELYEFHEFGSLSSQSVEIDAGRYSQTMGERRAAA